MKNNPVKPQPDNEEVIFFTVRDGTQLFVYIESAIKESNTTIYVISGINGINHKAEKDMILLLNAEMNRVVVIHPRGTGYSEGKRGDTSDFKEFINDYVEIITDDIKTLPDDHKIIMYGHSMSTAVLLAVADKIERVSGAILINPPYRLKKAKGMSPDFSEYLKYAWFYLFQKHKPIVNMAGDPAKMENEEDRKESELRISDPLLVTYFSLYTMTESRKIMNSMIEYSKIAHYPLLLIYGDKDTIVDKNGCDLIYKNWMHPNKQYVLLKNGSHGKSTVLLSKDTITKWINEL
jgi:alpha-beta hydrolase superfamily lysophospholipase